jgi:DNA polymerase iota
MQEAGGETKGAVGRDIGGMFRKQESTLKEWTAYDDEDPDNEHDSMSSDPEMQGSIEKSEEYEIDNSKGLEENLPFSTQRSQASDSWVEEETLSFEEYSNCSHCGAFMPSFAMAAHERFHQHQIE